MKKMFFTLLLVAGIGVCTHAQQSPLEMTDEQNNYFVELTGDNCSFEVTDAIPSISGTKVTITVTVQATFTPSERGHYKVVIKPQGQLRNILDSQQKSVTMYYDGSRWNPKRETVNFYCSVEDNTYNQCNSNSFIVSSCFKD
ncbi:MAG: hypothetical protein K5660_02315 [Paludibacteraceae bacterium]|nr:hypothetical protein [Paludibacteraceae bacterium]